MNVTLVTAKCFRCYGSATGGTFEEASLLIDHSVGLSRGIPCGDNYNAVQEIKENTIPTKTDDTLFNKVEPIPTEKIISNESKNTSKKKSKFH